MVLQKFGKRIKDLRKINKMSQETLAEKADLSRNFVGALERGEKEPKLITLVKIAEAFNISLSQLFSFPTDKEIINADAQILDKAVKILRQALEEAKELRKEESKQ